MSDILFNNQSPELIALADPRNLQSMILKNFENKLNARSANQNGAYVITDPHNVFNYLIEMFSTVGAEYSLATHTEISRRHAFRAQTFDDLYLHMSDFDYLNLFATPCPFIFQLTLDKNYLKNNAIKYNNYYSKCIIPKNTIFKLGKYEFGLHYPLTIKINNTTSDVIVLYDTTVANPLQNLNNNILDSFEHEFNGQNYVSILIPVHQFARSVIKETLISGHGFTKTISYNNKFYAVRLYTKVNGTMIELHQTHNEETYDPYTPTARIRLDAKTNKLRINIPQIYFNTNKLGTSLIIELFTTHGKLDIDVTDLTEYRSDIDFNLKDIGDTDIEYSKSLLSNPHKKLKLPVTKLSGGSDNLSFEELRQNVIHSSFHTTVLVTPLDLENAFKSIGFNVKKHLDNFTRRIYFAYKLLTDNTGMIMPTRHCPFILTKETPENVSTVFENLDGSITVLPTTIYQYNENTESCTILTDTKVNYLKALAREDFVEEMNSNVYTKSPFHIRLITDDKYGRASSYNLMNPTITKFIFEKENTNLGTQMVSADGTIVHLNEGTGGYKIQLLVKKTKDLLSIPEKDIRIYAYINSKDGVPVGIEAELVGTYVDQFVYELKINTNYWITDTDSLNVTNLTNDNRQFHHLIDLETKLNIVFMVDDKYFPGVNTDSSMYEGVPTLISNGFVCTTRQSCYVKFGENIDDIIYNNINLSWEREVYASHEADKPLVYLSDVYDTDEHGITKFTIDENNNVQLNILHRAGDPVLDDGNTPLYEYRKGDTIIQNGQPVVIKERIRSYEVQACMLDARIYASENLDQINYRNSINSTLMQYISLLRTKSKQLLEQTELYFRPINTLGNAKFHIGNGVYVNQSLSGRYKLKCHVPLSVYKNIDLQDRITETIITIIENYISESTISMTEIADLIKVKIPEYIKSVDVLGINGREDLQTMSIVNTDCQPSILTKLYINKNDVITLKKDVDIEYVSTDLI